MTIQRKKHPEYKIVADLLNMASNEFSNHGCNDYEIPYTKETVDLIEQAHKWNCNDNPSEPFELQTDGKTIQVMDYFLMSFFAHLFEELAKNDG